jgi:hypothetical protein
MKTNPTDTAFPWHCCDTGLSLGLTKREHFAAMAMQGMLACRPGGYQKIDYQWFPSEAIKMADALIESLNEVKNEG